MRTELSLDTSVPALTLKVGSYAVHHGGLGATRSLGRLGVPVYGVHEDRLAPAAVSRYTTGGFIWRTGGQVDYQHQMLDGIAAVAERIARPAVLVPTDDHAAIFVADHADRLRRWFLFPRQSPELVRSVTNKACLLERCRHHGVAAPAAIVASNAQALAAFAETTPFPFVAKTTVPLLLDDGQRARSVRVVGDAATLQRLLSGPFPMLLQEHIPIDSGEDWLFDAYCDESSECVVAFTGRKIRAFPPGTGEAALARSVSNPVLEHQARSLMKALSYSGPANLDYRFDRRDGTYKLLDFNPRLGGMFRLFETEAGVDVVRAMHLDLTGRPIPAAKPVEGRVVAIEGYEVRSAWSDLRAHRAGVKAVWSWWRTIDEFGWFARDDIVPPLVALGRAAVGAARQHPRPWRSCRPRHIAGRALRRNALHPRWPHRRRRHAS